MAVLKLAGTQTGNCPILMLLWLLGKGIPLPRVDQGPYTTQCGAAMAALVGVIGASHLLGLPFSLSMDGLMPLWRVPSTENVFSHFRLIQIVVSSSFVLITFDRILVVLDTRYLSTLPADILCDLNVQRPFETLVRGEEGRFQDILRHLPLLTPRTPAYWSTFRHDPTYLDPLHTHTSPRTQICKPNDLSRQRSAAKVPQHWELESISDIPKGGDSAWNHETRSLLTIQLIR